MPTLSHPFPAPEAPAPGRVLAGAPQVAGVAMSVPGPVSGGIACALALIRSRFEGNKDPAYDLPFHCAAHTVGVIRRSSALLRAMGAAEEELHLGLLAAAFHDTVQ